MIIKIYNRLYCHFSSISNLKKFIFWVQENRVPLQLVERMDKVCRVAKVQENRVPLQLNFFIDTYWI